MKIVKFMIFLLTAAIAGYCSAQGTSQTNKASAGSTGAAAGSPRNAVSTQPSNNPFRDPQGVPPAVSSNPARNTNQSSVPINTR